MRYPTLYKVTSKAGTIWQARLWDDTLKKYAYSRSTFKHSVLQWRVGGGIKSYIY
jgi:hypothetical protein